MAIRPLTVRRTVTEPEPWVLLTRRQQSLVRLQHPSPEVWWWRFDGSLALCVAPPLEREELWRREL